MMHVNGNWDTMLLGCKFTQFQGEFIRELFIKTDNDSTVRRTGFAYHLKQLLKTDKTCNGFKNWTCSNDG